MTAMYGTDSSSAIGWLAIAMSRMVTLTTVKAIETISLVYVTLTTPSPTARLGASPWMGDL